MDYVFKVVRKTQCIDEHTVLVTANSEDEAREKAHKGFGEYISLDRDEIEDVEILDVSRSS